VKQAEGTVTLTPEQIENLQKKARYVARKYSELADDFAQEVIVGALRGWKQTVEQAFIDYLRREHGSARNGRCSARRLAKARTFSLDEPLGEGEDSTQFHDIIGDPSADSEPQLDDRRLDGLLTSAELVVYERVFIDEEKKQDVAQSMGVTPARVSQILRPIKEKVKYSAMMAEVWDDYRSDPNYSKLEIDWIQL
jgi:DNA-directed RNA polymerase specialized sigma24 family protein